jgi:iron complex outermembrane recepter protein
MSELIQKNDNCATIHWKLLSSASALALTIAVSSVNVAKAEDADRPTIWIELGGQAEDITGQGQPFAPAFLAKNPDADVLWKGVSPIQAQKPPFSFGENAKITFQPQSSDWVFSAALRYGRTGTSNEVDHQTNRAFKTKYISGVPATFENIRGIDKFSDTHVHQSERHSILDFSAGKDLGLGMFGKDSVSTVSLGVRFAQFTSNATFDIRARPEVEFKYVNASQNYPSFFGPGVSFQFPYYHTYHATMQATRSFRGVGPSLSWNGNTPFAGNPQDGEITFDWGVNAALLFGRQKAHVKHQEYQRYVSWQFALNGGQNYHSPYPIVYGGHDNVRSVTVPNVGGTVGLSYRYQDAKISLGYRADMFFGAIDGGIDTRKSENRGFNGPYASISVGLGD